MSVFSLKLSQVWSWLWCQSANWSAFQLTSHCSQYSTQVNFHVLGFKSEIFHQINKDIAEAIKDQLRDSLRCQRHFTRQTSSSILSFCSHAAENPNINQDGWKFRVQKDSNMQKKGNASIRANIGQKLIKVSIAAILCELGELHTGGAPLSWAGRSSQMRAFC